MINEQPILTFITFLLAIIGYAGMTTVVLLSIKKPIPLLLWRITTLIIFVHVVLVWVHRYEFQFDVAVRNGYFGFIIFHSALLMILTSNFVKRSISIKLIRISFIIVAAGAIGATFRYDVVEVYKIPVIILSVIGLSSLAINIFSSKRLES